MALLSKSVLTIYRDIFSQNNSHETPRGSPTVRAIYGCLLLAHRRRRALDFSLCFVRYYVIFGSDVVKTYGIYISEMNVPYIGYMMLTANFFTIVSARRNLCKGFFVTQNRQFPWSRYCRHWWHSGLSYWHFWCRQLQQGWLCNNSCWVPGHLFKWITMF